MAITVTEEEEGKKVVHEGEVVGRVVDVQHGTAYVDPDPGLADTIQSKLGWGDHDEDTYPLQDESIEEITDDEIRLKPRM